MDISVLKGKTLTSVQATEALITFVTTEGDKYQLYHSQDCCESVYIESIAGDLQDLVGSALLLVEESSSDNTETCGNYEDSETWTFYKFATIKGYVDVRWYGTSNGYYSESVDFTKV